MEEFKEAELISHFKTFVSEKRFQRFEEVVAQRTRHITIALEDIFQSHNTSAVLRSCDCFGIQDVHIIENRNKYTVNPDVALGSFQWLNVNRYNSEENNTLNCIRTLKKKGYKIIATTPHTNDTAIEELDISSKTCLVFGTEKNGISNDVIENADGFVKIPMYGFTESFNISVSAALCLYELTKRLKSSSVKWELAAEEKNNLLLQWLKSTVQKSDLIEKDYFEKKNK